MKSREEIKFQGKLVKEIKERFPGSMVLRNDPQYLQGVPDLTVLYKDKWATLECKDSAKEANDPEPNQPYYVDKMNKMSFSRFIYPENKEEVLNDMERSFKASTRRKSRVPRSK